MPSYFVLGGINLQLAPSPVNDFPHWTKELATTLWHVPGAVLTVGLVLLLWFFFRRTAYYGALFAVGGDDVAAYSAGVNADRRPDPRVHTGRNGGRGREESR